MSGSGPPGGGDPLADVEEDAWFRRKAVCGAIARVVRYDNSEVPTEDILGLRVGYGGRLVVTGVRSNGRADRMGVEPGDELTSIDSWKGFAGCPATVIHASLVAPVTLVFLGFVGKFNAEVRVERSSDGQWQPVGLATDREVVPNDIAEREKDIVVSLHDEVVFNPGDSRCNSRALPVAESQPVADDAATSIPRQQTPRNKAEPLAAKSADAALRDDASSFGEAPFSTHELSW